MSLSGDLWNTLQNCNTPDVRKRRYLSYILIFPALAMLSGILYPAILVYPVQVENHGSLIVHGVLDKCQSDVTGTGQHLLQL